MWFKKKTKPIPWHTQRWHDVKHIIGVLTTLGAVSAAAIGYIQIDTTPFQNTTKILSVSANNHLYTSVDTQVVLPEYTNVIISINGHQLAHNVYPEGLPRGKIIIDNVLPFNVKDNQVLDVSVDIVFNGPRTLFVPERLTTSIRVPQEGKNAKNNQGSYGGYYTNPDTGRRVIWI